MPSRGTIVTAACLLSLQKAVHAYTPSTIGTTSRIHHTRGLGITTCSRLFNAVSDDNLERITDIETNNAHERINFDDKNKGAAEFNHLIPSTTTMVPSRMVGGSGRRATGLSSSVLLPLSESTPTTTNMLFQSSSDDKIIQPSANISTSWKEKLVDVSNLASLLCVLDCTLLPLVSIAIPTLSWGVGFITGNAAYVASNNSIMAGLSSFLAYIPALSHGIALYFVIPVGVLTTIVNYFFGHKEVKFSLLSLVGVALIYVANSSSGVGIPNIDAWLQASGIVAMAGHHAHHGHHVHDACGAMVGAATGMMAHTCPEGLAHRMTNTLGCAFLLGSNYASRKYMEEKSSGCAASAMAEALSWGGGDNGGKRLVCPPGCNCEAPSYGTSSTSRVGGETFFQWERSNPGGNGRRTNRGEFTTRLRR